MVFASIVPWRSRKLKATFGYLVSVHKKPDELKFETTQWALMPACQLVNWGGVGFQSSGF